MQDPQTHQNMIIENHYATKRNKWKHQAETKQTPTNANITHEPDMLLGLKLKVHVELASDNVTAWMASARDGLHAKTNTTTKNSDKLVHQDVHPRKDEEG